MVVESDGAFEAAEVWFESLRGLGGLGCWGRLVGSVSVAKIGGLVSRSVGRVSESFCGGGSRVLEMTCGESRRVRFANTTFFCSGCFSSLLLRSR